MGEIDLMIEGLAEVTEDPEADTLPEIDSAVSVSKAGDLWLLGKESLDLRRRIS